VQITNEGYGGGFAAVLNDGRFSDDTAPWKCTQSPPVSNDWTRSGFNDKKWRAPVKRSPVGKQAFTSCQGFMATWMWTDTSFSQVTTLYCRLVLVSARLSSLTYL
jgi:hypothetical protein